MLFKTSDCEEVVSTIDDFNSKNAPSTLIKLLLMWVLRSKGLERTSANMKKLFLFRGYKIIHVLYQLMRSFGIYS